jgi:hypothetical protein
MELPTQTLHKTNFDIGVLAIRKDSKKSIPKFAEIWIDFCNVEMLFKILENP